MKNRMQHWLLVAVFLLALLPVGLVHAQSYPENVQVQVVLYTKGDGETEVNYYLRWTETAPRDQIEMILDCWGGDLGYGDVTVYSEGERVFDLTNDEDHGQVGNSGAYHRHILFFPETTKSGGDYELAIGYGSRLETFPFDGSDGMVEFNWTANPWPFPVQTYEIDWVAEKMPPDINLVKGNFSTWDLVEKRDPPSAYGGNKLAIRLVKERAPADWTPVLSMNVPAKYFGIEAVSTAKEVATVAPKKPTSTPRSNPTAPSTINTKPEGKKGSFWGAFFLIAIILGMIGVLVMVWVYSTRKRRRPSRPSVSEPELPAYRPPVVSRETKPQRRKVLTDLTRAEVAYLLGAGNDRIVLAIVQDLVKAGVLEVLAEEPLALRVIDDKLTAYLSRITRAERAVIEAVQDDGSIDVEETELIVAVVRAMAEMHLAEKEADKELTRSYYEEKIRRLEQELRRHDQPVTVLRDNDDFWFWLWLMDRHYRYADDYRPAPGTYYYPRPQHAVYVRPDGAKVPIKDISFRQTLADFDQPQTGLAKEISEAADRMARTITGAAAGKGSTPAPKPHDACVKAHSVCVTRPHDKAHSACVHDNCVAHDKAHSACVTRPHDKAHSACVHSNCVSHSACVHSNCVSRPSHSACVKRAR